MKHVFFILLLCFSLGSLKAELLSPQQVQMFMETHGADIDAALSGKGHKAYRTIAVAKTLLEENPFHSQEGNSYYANVILSVLWGVGFGGINAQATASEIETKAAVGALSLIGFNLENQFTYSDKTREREPTILTHLSTVEAILKQSFDRRASPPPSGVKDLEYKILFNDAVELELAGDYVHKYCSARDFAASKAVGERTETGRYHGGPGTRAPQRPIPTPPKAPAQQKPKPAPASTSGTIKTDDGEAWNGVLFRSKAAAEEALRRGGTDPVAQYTGNLQVMYKGKSTFSSSTATVIMCSTAKGGFTFYAITNAHCVTPDSGDVIDSISLVFPSSETLVIDQVYRHPFYNTGNAYDVAILKGACRAQFPYILLYNFPISSDVPNGYVVSFGDIHYVDGLRITKEARGRALSIKRVTNVGSAPQYIMETPKLALACGSEIGKGESNTDKKWAYGVVFPTVEIGVSHKLDAAHSFGASGSPFFISLGGSYYLAGLLETAICEWGNFSSLSRTNGIASVYPYKEFIDSVTGGTAHPNWRTTH